MTEGNFVDYIKMYVCSGNGGKGSVHLHREKYITKGGPDGGDGGRGGHIILKGNQNLWTLHHLKFKKHFRAGHGGHGSKSRSTGADGTDVYVEVPLGTVVKDNETNNMLFEITTHGQEVVLCQGGMGGRGNWHFKSSTNQTPRYAQPGIPGEEKNVTIELKILADVGLVGFPNAGKSTLLNLVMGLLDELQLLQRVQRRTQPVNDGTLRSQAARPSPAAHPPRRRRAPGPGRRRLRRR